MSDTHPSVTARAVSFDPAGATPLDDVPTLPHAAVDAVLVVDAALLGERVPAARRVVGVMARGGLVSAEWRGPAGVVRVVRVGEADLVDAGAHPAGDDVLLPPLDVQAAADGLAARTSRPVVLASPAGVDGLPRVVARAGVPPEVARCAVGAWSACGTGAAVVEGMTPTPATPTVGDQRPSLVRAALGVRPGTAEAIEVGLPPAPGDAAEPVEERVVRACRVACAPYADIETFHPLRKHLRDVPDLTRVSTSVLQVGVLVEAPDDYLLGVAVGRLVVALAGEGLQAVPVQHERTSGGVSALVGYVGDEHA